MGLGHAYENQDDREALEEDVSLISTLLQQLHRIHEVLERRGDEQDSGCGSAEQKSFDVELLDVLSIQLRNVFNIFDDSKRGDVLSSSGNLGRSAELHTHVSRLYRTCGLLERGFVSSG